ncbi:TIGR00730 family Rossman fold protein [Halobacillus sp. A1]|uniref:LOG family protein n=1 Tax=Halobacillus sp. A1 TaxID=2880262 RepID=UPI0020A6B5EA|nr:TIGR00730 family Rossman fold protein [Halobacillus sp. A1]MCP3032165.1 TIGR00730 family Rossman fold protein [Halobacillus sp. A1]
MKRISVFAGSSAGNDPAFTEHTKKLGEAFAEKNIELVYGGAQSGLMGVLADAILEAGGKVTGIMPTPLFEKEIVHQGLTQFIEVETMHQRKEKMSELADGFIALPGGFGTFEELFETITWAQIGLHVKPIGVFNIEGYYTPLMELLDHAIEAGFVRAANRSLLIESTESHDLLSLLENKADE